MERILQTPGRAHILVAGISWHIVHRVHVLLTPVKKESVSLLMKNLSQRSVKYINRTYPHSDVLCEGRFKFCLTQTEGYVVTCYRLLF